MTTERRYTQAEVAALLDATSGEQEQAARWAALEQSLEEQAERRYEESVTLRLADLRHGGAWWCYGYVYPVKEGDTAQGWGVWLATAGPREWDTNASEQVDDWSTFEGCEDEQAARAEATQRNRGEG